MNKVKYENKTIAYTVNRAKIKNFYITIQNGEVVIKAPRFATSSQIQNVVEAKRQWIMQKLQEYQQSPTKVKEYADGEKFQILGEAYYLNIYYKDINMAMLNVENGKIAIILPLRYAEEDNTEQIKKMIDKMYYMIAEKEVENSMEKMRKLVGLAPEEYRIENTEKTLGKCIDKIITINPNLMQFKKETIEYVIIHEFCHLKYKSHCKKFYEIIEKNIKDYKKYEKELEGYQY